MNIVTYLTNSKSKTTCGNINCSWLNHSKLNKDGKRVSKANLPYAGPSG